MRIIAGSAGGRRLRAPPGATTRPTSDRVREALFSILGPVPEDARVLDLFAGSGSLGLEALSRGAASGVFVDSSAPALQALKHNIAELRMDARAEVRRDDALRGLKHLVRERASFTWIFLDPPYASDLAARALEIIGASELLQDEGTVILEHEQRRVPDDVFGCLVKGDVRRYGDTGVSFYERSSS